MEGGRIKVDGERLVRFIPYEDAVERVFRPDAGTFCLNSTRYYRERGYEKPSNPSFDRHENNVRLGRSIKVTNESLVSCWVKLQQPAIDWVHWSEIFPEGTVAILSNVERTRRLIQNHLGWFINIWPVRFEYGNVIYYCNDCPENAFDGVSLAFYKHERYRLQEEYRFALRLKDDESDLTALIFHVEPSEYVDSIFVNSARPECIQDQEKRTKLHHLMSLAGCSNVPIEWREQFVPDAVGRC